MEGIVMQDWLTIFGSSATSVTQSADRWLDMTPYQDVQFWLDVREVSFSGGILPQLNMFFETAPTRDEALFKRMTGPLTMPPSQTPVLALLSTATVPVARWMRWRLQASGSPPPTTWDTTFRVLVSANAPGSVAVGGL